MILLCSSLQERISFIDSHYESVPPVTKFLSTGENSSLVETSPPVSLSVQVPPGVLPPRCTPHRAATDGCISESAYAEPAGLVESAVPAPSTIEHVSYAEVKESCNPQVHVQCACMMYVSRTLHMYLKGQHYTLVNHPVCTYTEQKEPDDLHKTTELYSEIQHKQQGSDKLSMCRVESIKKEQHSMQGTVRLR